MPTALLLEGTGSIAHDTDRKTVPIEDDEQCGTARGEWRDARGGALCDPPTPERFSHAEAKLFAVSTPRCPDAWKATVRGRLAQLSRAGLETYCANRARPAASERTPTRTRASRARRLTRRRSRGSRTCPVGVRRGPGGQPAAGHLAAHETWSAELSCARGSARAAARRAVLLVCDVLAAGDRAAGLVVLLHGDAVSAATAMA